MKCPLCEVDLVMTERSGVEIDYCPKCRGIWLDRGELDKIIERATQVESRPTQANSNVDRSPQEFRHHDEDEDHHRYGGGHEGGYGQRRSWWQELFD